MGKKSQSAGPPLFNRGTYFISEYAKIGKDVHVSPFCLIESATVGNNVYIGPYTHLFSGAQIGDDCHLDACYIEDARIGRGTRVYRTAHIMTQAVIGEECLIGANCFIADGVKIGNRSRLMLNVGIGRATIVGDDVYMGPNTCFANSNPGDPKMHSSFVPDRCWIGTNAVILPGIQLGEGCRIGAGAVVVHDVPPGATVVGNPARVLNVDFNYGPDETDNPEWVQEYLRYHGKKER